MSGEGRLLVCGSVNMDLLVQVEAAPAAGETVLARSSAEGLGGKGANQAVAAAGLGQPTSLLARTGEDDLGVRARAGLVAAGVDVGALRGSAQPTGRALVLVEPSGENRIVVVPGANAELAPPTADDLRGVAGVLCQLETPLEVVRATLGSARAAGLLTALNAAPAVPDAVDLLSLVDVLVVNEGEALRVAGRDDVPAAVETLLAAGAGAVVVTLGARGATWHDAEDTRTRPSYAVEVVDTTGAGDCFVGALVARLLAGDDADEALAFACAAGALATTRPGASARPGLEEVTALRRRG